VAAFGSATWPRESVLPIRLRPDFSVVFEVMQERLSTGPVSRRPGSGLSGPVFSGPHDCGVLVNSLQKDVWLAVPSENRQGNQIGRLESATLWLRCMEKTTGLVIELDKYTSDAQNVRIKFDDGPIQKQWRNTLRGGEGVGVFTGAKVIPLIKKMFDKRKMIVSYDTYSNNVEFVFNISGLRERIDPLAAACNWKP